MNRPAQKNFWLVINLIICALGTIGFIFFAVGMERNNSWANKFLAVLLAHPWVVILTLAALGAAVLWPLLRKKPS